ncbi:MAG: haloacid dehalogenase type II [Burkholderiaceae bacterium]|jgi:2-haloacid dehalogenase
MALNTLPKVLAFDAYGTLFDVLSVSQRLEAYFPGEGRAMAQLLRDKQLEYSRLRTIAGGQHIKPFWQITQDALRFTLRAFDKPPQEDVVRSVMQSYAQISAYPEVIDALGTLREAGIALVVLSNGNAEMLNEALRHSGLTPLFDGVLSAEQVGCFKVDPRVYALACSFANCKPEEAVLISSNAWDVAGARWQGLQAYWVNRANLPFDELDTLPSAQGKSLLAFVDWVLGERR